MSSRVALRAVSNAFDKDRVSPGVILSEAPGFCAQSKDPYGLKGLLDFESFRLSERGWRLGRGLPGTEYIGLLVVSG